MYCTIVITDEICLKNPWKGKFWFLEKVVDTEQCSFNYRGQFDIAK